MTSIIEGKIAALGLSLPSTCAPRGRFLPWTRTGSLVFLAGQICEWNGEAGARGQVGVDIDLAAAQLAARDCALNLIFHLRDACDGDGDLDRVARCIRVGVSALPMNATVEVDAIFEVRD